MSSFSGNTNNFLPETFIIPENEEEKNVKLYQYFNMIAAATNTKDSGLYDEVETITGQQFVPTFSTTTAANVSYRTVYRKVIDFGGLPNAGTKSVAHGITISSSISFTKIYGAATDPSTSFIPLPFASPTLNLNISLELDATNVIITTGVDRTGYTRTFVVLEWITTI